MGRAAAEIEEGGALPETKQALADALGGEPVVVAVGDMLR